MDRTQFNVQDASLVKTAALPNGAASTQIAGIDLGALSGRGARLADCELVVEAPVLSAARLPDTQTVTYKIQMDDDSAFGGPTDIAPSIIVQTGAGGAGAAAQTYRWRIPTGCKRYIRVMATKTGAADASGASMTVSLRF